MRDKRDVVLDFASNPDAILNALHQEGYAIVPRAHVLDERDRAIAGAGLHALLGMWASARESFGDMVPDLAHGDAIRDLAERLTP